MGFAAEKRVFALLVCMMLSSNGVGQTGIRINQLGYLPESPKPAILVSPSVLIPPSRFAVIDVLTGDTVLNSSQIESCGPFGPFAATFRLDFSAVRSPGAYVVAAGGTVSPVFRIDREVYDGSADFLLRYLRQQRCGFNPFLRDSCHTRDGFLLPAASEDTAWVDVTGGWHDAADYLRYVTTSATVVAQLLLAYEVTPEVFGDLHRSNGLPGSNGIPDVLDEARWGLEWLLKMNPSPGVMYHQVADDRDHRGFRLPTDDTVDYGRGRERPVYPCTGKPQGLFEAKNRSTGLASIAGKFSSAFAIGALVFSRRDPDFAGVMRERAYTAFDAGLSSPGVCQTAPCRSPYFYEEENWVDDMELAAVQLARLSGDVSYLAAAAEFARQEPIVPWMGAERVRHYQWYPFVNLGHPAIARLDAGRFRRDALGHMRAGLARVATRARENAFRMGTPFVWCSNNFVSALLAHARLYRQLSGDSSFAEIEAGMRDWLFGCNPWGTSMVVGLPRSGISPRDPHSAFSHAAGFPVDGGLVDGPVAAEIFRSLRGVTLSRPDPFAPLQSALAVYHDDWADYASNEPTLDGTAELLLSLASLESEGNSPFRGAERRRGGVVRLDSMKKEITLLFTGHEFADDGGTIRTVLRRLGIKAGFFFTGDFYRAEGHRALIDGLRADGHYLGPHSDRHLLYAPWDRPDSTLVSHEEFVRDLRANYDAMEKCGVARSEASLFVPPYEWYNDTIAVWAKEVGVQILAPTLGTLAPADYTFPPGRYVTAATIVRSILTRAQTGATGLNGFLLLMHVGADPRRPDRLADRLDELLRRLLRLGYRFVDPRHVAEGRRP